jgi:hypothetical protein
MKLLIMQFSPASYMFIALRSRYSLRTFSQTPSIYVVPSVSYPYNFQEKLYFCIRVNLRVLGSR